jgi:UDP-N-acetylglucosamine--N-acetylmuramyl-(pentapeptide) pyrophosphoryl-undecaprenol N-acetylglucosamine transferase
VKRPCILIAGGGTGGHVYPAVAVAEALQAAAEVDLVFCGTARGVEARVVPARGWKLELLDVEPMKGGGPVRALRGAIVAALATRRAFAVVRACSPRAVLSVGGYASGPVTLAAAMLGIPVTVMEPNSVVGLANRLVAPFAKRAYLAWPEAEAPFRVDARRVYGVPLRSGFAPRPYAPRATRRVLVLGGSQGAQALNERMPQAVARLRALAGLEILHQAGRDRDEGVRAAYGTASNAQVRVVPFVDEVAREIGDADLVVARAGASTLAEITAIGRPAILVPFPHAADDHQARNAEALARAGAAVCLRQDVADPARLAAAVERLLQDGPARVAMADASRACGKPTAAADVADDLLALAGVARRPRGATNGRSHLPSTAHEAR